MRCGLCRPHLTSSIPEIRLSVRPLHSRYAICAPAFLLLLVSLACRAVSAQPAPTATHIPTASSTRRPSPTTTPTATHTPTPQPTSTPTVTRTPRPDYAATSAAGSTHAAETAMVDITKDLKGYGLTTDEGYLVWLSTVPITLTVDTYGAMDTYMIDPRLVVKDFVFQTEVSWKSSGGLAGCGYMFRTDRSLSRGDFYDFVAIRLSGLPLWWASYWKEGSLERMLSPNYATSAAIRQKYGSTNTFAVVAIGDHLTFYANGDRLKTILNDKLSEGRIAYQVQQESGETTCLFKNGWVWVLK